MTIVSKSQPTGGTRTVIARPVAQAIKFVGQMFKDRKYNIDHRKLVYDRKHDLWEMFTETQGGHKVLAAFSKCKAFGEVMQLDTYMPSDNTGYESDDNIDTFSDSKKTSKSGGLSVSFVRSFVEFVRKKQVKVVVLVTDLISTQAVKLMHETPDIFMTHFTYEETGILHMPRHVAQPTVFRPLSIPDKKAFVEANPRYRQELERLPVDDPLVKYYGLHADDVVYEEYYDEQTGLETTHVLIVERL